MEVRFAVCVQTDGLDVEGFKEDLSKYGTVTEVQDHELEDGTPVKLYVLEGSLGEYLKIKLYLNCATAEDNRYVLFPMAR